MDFRTENNASVHNMLVSVLRVSWIVCVVSIV